MLHNANPKTICEINSINSHNHICQKKWHVLQHENTDMHKTNLTKDTNQTLISPCHSEDRKKNFYNELCSKFVGANISLKNLNKKTLRLFLERNCKNNIPEESTLRKNYLSQVYDDVSIV